MQITHLLRHKMYHSQVSLGGSVDKSFAGRNLNFFFVRTSVLFFINVKVLTKMKDGLLVGKPVASRLDGKHVRLDMT